MMFNKKIVNICTPEWSDLESYGKLAIVLSEHLSRKGFYVNEFGSKSRTPKIIPSMGGIFFAYPTSYQEYGNLMMLGKKVAITMFESTKLPGGWVDILNTFNSVVVPSKFCYDVFRDNGVLEDRLNLVRLGLNEPFLRSFSIRRKREGQIRFLAFLDRGRRKGWHIALQAFLLAFGSKREDVSLTLKSKAEALPYGVVSRYDNVFMDERDLTVEELAEYYLDFDVLINPNTGEGFGLIPREFAATGGIPMATNWGGTADEIEHWGIPIYTEDLVPAWPHHPYFEGLGVWASPDVVQLSNQLLNVYDNFDEYSSRAANHWSEFVRKHYTWDNYLNTVEGLWNDNN